MMLRKLGITRWTAGRLLLGAAIIFGITNGRHSEAMAIELAQTPSRSNEFANYRREGSVEIQIGRITFSVPRKILRAVTLSNGQMDRRWPCKNIQLDARDFFIAVTRTHAGDAFYENWQTKRRLPVHIEVVRRDRIKNYTSDHLKAAERRANVKIHEQAGYKIVASGPDEFFGMSGIGLRAHDGHPVIFQCSATVKLLSEGRACRASYPYSDALDILYQFDDSKLPRNEWRELDERVRRFVEELMTSDQRIR